MTTCPGTRIKELRKMYGMSQEELGRRVGVQRAAINKYEKGSVTNIPIATIEQIANVFDVSPSYLVGWELTKSNAHPLSTEVKVLQGIEFYYGSESVELLEGFTHLNPQGKKRVQAYVEDMALIYEE